MFGQHRDLLHWRLCRISLKNLSKSKTIQNVEVKLTNIEPPAQRLQGRLPVHLRFMNDDSTPPKRRIDIHPNTKQFVDVIAWRVEVERGGPEFIIEAIEDVNKNIPVGDYKLTIEVSGQNARSSRKTFCVGMRNQSNDIPKIWIWPD